MNILKWFGWKECEFDQSRRLFLRKGACVVLAPVVAPALATHFLSPTNGWHRSRGMIRGMNTAAFSDGMSLDFYPMAGGVARGRAIIEAVDPMTSTLWFSSPLPSGIGVGDYLLNSDFIAEIQGEVA